MRVNVLLGASALLSQVVAGSGAIGGSRGSPGVATGTAPPAWPSGAAISSGLSRVSSAQRSGSNAGKDSGVFLSIADPEHIDWRVASEKGFDTGSSTLTRERPMQPIARRRSPRATLARTKADTRCATSPIRTVSTTCDSLRLDWSAATHDLAPLSNRNHTSAGARLRQQDPVSPACVHLAHPEAVLEEWERLSRPHQYMRLRDGDWDRGLAGPGGLSHREAADRRAGLRNGHGVREVTNDEVCAVHVGRAVNHAMCEDSRLLTYLRRPTDAFAVAIPHQIGASPRRYDGESSPMVVDPFKLQRAAILHSYAVGAPCVPMDDRSAAACLTQYIDALHGEIAGRESVRWLLPDQAPDYPAPWYDRIAIRDAMGLDVRGLAQQLRASGQSDPKLASLVKQRFGDMGESTWFPIGTPLQSMHSVVLKYGRSAGVFMPAQATSACVRAQFAQLESAWAKAGNPGGSMRLMLAHHVAISRGVLIARGITTRQAVADEVERRLASHGGARRSAMPEGNGDPSEYDASRRSMRATANDPTRYFSKRALKLFKHLEQTMVVVQGDSDDNVCAGLLAYYDGVEAGFEDIKMFDEREAAISILMKRFGVSRRQVTRVKTQFQVRISAGALYPRKRIETTTEPLFETFLNAKGRQGMDKWLHVGKQRFDVDKELSGARIHHDNEQVRDPILQGKAKAVLHAIRLPVNPKRVDKVAGAILQAQYRFNAISPDALRFTVRMYPAPQTFKQLIRVLEEGTAADFYSLAPAVNPASQQPVTS
jgi:hypothetical protein